MIRRWLSLACFLAMPALAQEPPLPELELLSEHPIEGMAQGNLSGMAWCGDALWGVSDRDDAIVYRFDTREDVWRAEAEAFELPPPPDTGLPWGVRVRSWVMGLVRGGHMDFEGMSCDSLGNRYLVSEAYASVLKLNPAGTAEWLTLPDSLVRQARASGMLLKFNALFEGIAVDPAGDRMWLAAERERRGLLVVHRRQSRWICTGGCVLMSEGGRENPPHPLEGQSLQRDFSGLAFFEDKLFTLERFALRICRRTASTGAVERCWSFAETASAEHRLYDSPYSTVESLWIDADGAWIGLDNNELTRQDGESRPIVWRFAAPKGGWSARR